VIDAIGIRELPWDTGFFGVRCCRIELNANVGRQRLEPALASVGDAVFITIVNRDCRLLNAELLAMLTDAAPADTIVTFEKPVTQAAAAPISDLNARDNLPASQEIVELANTVFRDSRFVRDRRLYERGGGRLHGEWVKNAFNTPGRYFIMEMDENQKLAGFLLFSLSDDTLTVELIGVNSDCRRQGVGRRLWNAAETEAKARGCATIRVGTQLTNTDALNFYIAAGCRVARTDMIYHWWRGALS
jgi:ribosomal protein S18 acetylase RimI-like enzyme